MPKKPPVMDAEMQAFAEDVALSIRQAKAGEYARVTTGEEIARRASGRPVQVVHKAPVTLRLDPEPLARWRASGKGWQTRAAAVLARHAP